jgi:CheY-like chemotaxis protein
LSDTAEIDTFAQILLATKTVVTKMHKAQFLWVDDEIDLLKPYVLFLEEKGYRMECANNGHDAIEKTRQKNFDMIFLDEHMPGLSGLETLNHLHDTAPNVPVVMVTKSEDEGIMECAIGKKIADYLIKPVNPNQVLLTIKKILDKKELVSGAVTVTYRQEFSRLNEEIETCCSAEEWTSLYRKLIYWELELHPAENPMRELLASQKMEANSAFARFIRKNYSRWMRGDGDPPLLSPSLFEKAVFPFLSKGEKLFFILIDNFRLDQWYAVKDLLSDHFNSQEDIYFSILPTVTSYARNSIFSGLMPRKIAMEFPELWVDDNEEENKNQQEESLIRAQLQRKKLSPLFSYQKVNSNKEATELFNRFADLEKHDLHVWVFNFIDMLSHARTDSKMIRELTTDEAAYRTLTRSWFLHSPLYQLLKTIAAKGYRAVFTTDHGSIRVKNGLKVIGDKETNTNLRYKVGKNLGYESRKLFEMLHPEDFGLPTPFMSTRYIFATQNDFFVYPNNYNQHVSLYTQSYQHGGISMEEMMVPFITLNPK